MRRIPTRKFSPEINKSLRDSLYLMLYEFNCITMCLCQYEATYMDQTRSNVHTAFVHNLSNV